MCVKKCAAKVDNNEKSRHTPQYSTDVRVQTLENKQEKQD
jgi:hypothetical protein